MNLLADFILQHGGISIWRGLYPPDAQDMMTLALSFTWHDSGIWRRDDGIIEEKIAAHADGNRTFVSEMEMLNEIEMYLDGRKWGPYNGRAEKKALEKLGIQDGDLRGMRIIHDGEWVDVTREVALLLDQSKGQEEHE